MKAKAPRPKLSWNYLFWLGPLLITAGFSAGLVSGQWTTIPTGLLVAGAVITVTGLLYWLYTSKGFWERRSTQAGTNALLATLAVLTILGVINFAADRYPVRIDLTENQALSLAPQSREIAAKLTQPLQVLVFTTSPSNADRLLLEQYQRNSQSKLSYEFVNPNEQLNLTQKYNIPPTGGVVLVSGERSQSLLGGLSEVNLTSELAKLVNDKRVVAYFTTGHSERPLAAGEGSFSQAAAALQQQNVTPQPLNLIEQQKIPADANLVVVAGPKRPFLPGEVKILDAYLNNGGKVLLLLDPQPSTVPADLGLESLLKSWGVTLDNRLVIDGSGAGQMANLSPAAPIVIQYGDHPITRNFGQGVSFYNFARSVSAQPIGNEQIANLLVTNNQSWAETDVQNPQLQFDPQKDKQGPLNLGVAISRTLQATPGQPPQEARLVVIGNSEFAADAYFKQGLNGDVFLNSVNWLSNQAGQVLSIRPKDPTNRRLQLTVATNRWVALIGLGILPFGSFLLAFMTWWRRR